MIASRHDPAYQPQLERRIVYRPLDRTGAGPAVWCDGLLPDYHAFRGCYAGYAFPLRDNQPGHGPFNVSLALLRGLSSSYGVLASAEDAFDAMLALLSATSYTLRFAEDLEDVFPHVPFPSDHVQFLAAAELGREIRAVETFARQPGANFLKRSLARVETEPGERPWALERRQIFPVCRRHRPRFGRRQGNLGFFGQRLSPASALARRAKRPCCRSCADHPNARCCGQDRRTD